MAKLTALLLALSQLSSVHSLPAREFKHEPAALKERAISFASLASQAPTTVYSKANPSSVQSALPTAFPSIIGVCYITTFAWFK